jgi:tetratricopeptide (TPR) repeat protein
MQKPHNIVVVLFLWVFAASSLTAQKQASEVEHRADSLYNKAVCLCKQQTPDVNAALVCLNAALSLNPKHSASAYKWRSWAKQRIGDVQGAIEDISTAITMQPQEAKHYAIRADVKQHMGDIAGAMDDIGLALQLAETTTDTTVYQAIRTDYLTEKQRRDSLAVRKK